jgi:hypothetical protein
MLFWNNYACLQGSVTRVAPVLSWMRTCWVHVLMDIFSGQGYGGVHARSWCWQCLLWEFVLPDIYIYVCVCMCVCEVPFFLPLGFIHCFVLGFDKSDFICIVTTLKAVMFGRLSLLNVFLTYGILKFWWIYQDVIPSRNICTCKNRVIDWYGRQLSKWSPVIPNSWSPCLCILNLGYTHSNEYSVWWDAYSKFRL